MKTGVTAVYKMIFIRIEELLILFAGLVQLSDQIHGILEMHVVVTGAMNEQKAALQIFSEETW